MPKPLVIVESPKKARSIADILGDGYNVQSSVGHIRDLPRSAKEIPEAYKSQKWSREGESISWHLMEVLSPRVPVRRMVFHEITKAAIEAAVTNTRDVDMALVDAQETRRILDRLFGWRLIEVLRRKGPGGATAGRVQ